MEEYNDKSVNFKGENMEKNTKKSFVHMYTEHRNAIWSTALVALFTFIWLSNSTVNVPIMDYWRYINDLTVKVFRGSFSFNDIWIPSGGHRPGMVYFLTALNIKYFKMNTLVGVYLGWATTGITCIVIYMYLVNIYCKKGKLDQLQKLYIVVPMVLFSLTQWEIFTLDFSFVFSVRRLMYIISFIVVEKFVIKNEGKGFRFEHVFLLICVMLLFSGAYLPTFVGAIISTLFMSVLLIQRFRKIPVKYIYISVVMICCVFLYTYGLPIINDSSNTLSILLDDVSNGNLIKGLLMMMGSSLISASLVERMGESLYVAVGVVVFIMYVYSICLYLRKKYWTVTFLPISLISYALINMLFIYYARVPIFGLNYLVSSRYSFETGLGILGITLIVINYILSEKSINRQDFNSFICTSILFVIVSLLTCSFGVETKIAKYRKAYQNNLVDMMVNIDDYFDSELSVFQANSPEQVRNGIQLMERYNLGIFKYLGRDLEISEVGSELSTARKIFGYYEDGWISSRSRLAIKTQDQGKVQIYGNYPGEIIEPLNIIIRVDNEIHERKILENNFIIEIDVPKEQSILLQLDCNFKARVTSDDIRDLSLVIDDIIGL